MNPLYKYWYTLNQGTPSEWCIEPAIASLGRPYRWQFPIWGHGFFPDFALIDDKVIIEIDGNDHMKPDKIAKDAERTRVLERDGWIVLRCTNEEAVNDPFGTIDSLMEWAGLPYRTRRFSDSPVHVLRDPTSPLHAERKRGSSRGRQERRDSRSKGSSGSYPRRPAKLPRPRDR